MARLRNACGDTETGKLRITHDKDKRRARRGGEESEQIRCIVESVKRVPGTTISSKNPWVERRRSWGSSDRKNDPRKASRFVLTRRVHLKAEEFVGMDLGMSITSIFVHKVDKCSVVSLRRLGRQAGVRGVVQHFLHPCEKSFRSMQRNRFGIISADSCSKMRVISPQK